MQAVMNGHGNAVAKAWDAWFQFKGNAKMCWTWEEQVWDVWFQFRTQVKNCSTKKRRIFNGYRNMAAQARRGNGSTPGRKEAELLNGTRHFCIWMQSAEGCTWDVRQVEDWKTFMMHRKLQPDLIAAISAYNEPRTLPTSFCGCKAMRRMISI